MHQVGGDGSLKRKLPAGFLDAGFASLGALAIGVFAAKFFSAANLGGYSLFFRALLVSAVFSKQLIFTPAEVRSLDLPQTHRLGLVRQSLRIGAVASLVATLAILGVVAASSDEIDRAAVTAFAFTAAGAAFLSPIQDHLRRMLHIDGRSWTAS